eukprot:TRINITY_DN40976_c0_g1_i3.p1 TRINITY_DN40976_c0_g1~~TRINITY_DN40976_c0_g1_i3.p1  ORF type:complete len:278 (-),score=-4.38 TRINITY_DN40976_c0_g1_i3:116-949(-)
MNRRPIGEILRATQKDEESIDRLRSSVSSLGLDLFGARSWIHKEKWVDSYVKFGYYCLTTLSDFQTLGEEYTGLVQCTSDLQLPSKFSRFLFIFLKSFGARVTSLILDRLQTSKPENTSQIETLKKLVEFVESIHTCIFYYQGLFFEISKRLSGIEYVKPGKQESNKRAFRILGYVASINLFLNIAIQIYTFYARTRSKASLKSESGSSKLLKNLAHPSLTCAVCLEAVGSRGCAAATFCGHVGCWTCLLETATISAECPMCRARIVPNQIIPLQNL